MIANILNTLLGLVLVYAAVLKPELVDGQPVNLLVAAFVIAGCALWARSSDRMSWFSITNIVAGALAALLAAVQLAAKTSALVSFWGVFWIGLIVSVVALWAALYQPREELA
jgi:hypothetical protein